VNLPREYVNNAEFLQALIDYKQSIKASEFSGLPKPRVPEYIGECLLKITENIAKRPNFSGYTFIEDMKGDAIQNCLLYLHNFNEDSSKNPFGYFSKIIWYAFLRRIDHESTETYVKFKSLEASPLFTDHKMESKKFVNLNKSVLNENTHHIIEKYEDKLLRKKKTKDIDVILTKLEEFME
jgi:hypothetical protein